MNALLVRSTSGRIFETPAAKMTTLASPTLSGPTPISLWRVAVKADQQGPMHVIDSIQIWTLLSGTAVFEVDRERFEMSDGDTIQISGQALRQLQAITDVSFLVCGESTARASSGAPGAAEIAPPWIG